MQLKAWLLQCCGVIKGLRILQRGRMCLLCFGRRGCLHLHKTSRTCAEGAEKKLESSEESL